MYVQNLNGHSVNKKWSFLNHCLYCYLGSLSNISERSTPLSFNASYKFLCIIAVSSICPVFWSIKSPVTLLMLKPRNVILSPSGLKNKYGCGLKNKKNAR